MPIAYELRHKAATLIFDVEDRFARERGVRGRHPPPIGRIKFYCVGRMMAGGRQDFASPLELVTRRNPSGFYLFFNMVRRPDASIHQSVLTEGTYVVRVESQFYQWSERVDIALPAPDNPTGVAAVPASATVLTGTAGVDFLASGVVAGDIVRNVTDGSQGTVTAVTTTTVTVDALAGGTNNAFAVGDAYVIAYQLRVYGFDLGPGYAYPFPSESTLPGGQGPTLLRGSVHRPNGAGIAGTTVEVVGQSHTYWTDDSGQWVLVFPDSQLSGDVMVRLTSPNGTSVDVANVPIVRGRQASLAQTAVCGWVLTNAGVGIAGAVIQVSGHPGSTMAARDGRWFYYFGLNQAADTVSVTAILPDGRSQTQSNIQVQPRATVVVPTYRFP